MKKAIRVLGIIFITVLVTACSSDDDSSISNEELIGTWNMVSYTYDGTTTVDFSGETLVTEFTGNALNIDATMTFSNDPRTFTAQGSYDIELEITVFGQTQTQVAPIDNFESVGTWSQDGNILTMNGEFIAVSTPVATAGEAQTSQEYIIEELSETTLRLSSTISQEISDGFSDNLIDSDFELVFTKR